MTLFRLVLVFIKHNFGWTLNFMLVKLETLIIADRVWLFIYKTRAYIIYRLLKYKQTKLNFLIILRLQIGCKSEINLFNLTHLLKNDDGWTFQLFLEIKFRYRMSIVFLSRLNKRSYFIFVVISS